MRGGQSAGYRITEALVLLDTWARQIRPRRNETNKKWKQQQQDTKEETE